MPKVERKVCIRAEEEDGDLRASPSGECRSKFFRRVPEVTELCQEKEMESLKKLLVQESHYLEQEEASSEANDQVNTQMKS